MDGVGQVILGAGVTTAFHPLGYVRTLIQLGYEPTPPAPSISIFGRKVLSYAGPFKYLSLIRREDGFFGMYRGLGARLTQGIIGNLVSNAVSIHIRGEAFQRRASSPDSSELDGDEESLADQIVVLVKDTCLETVTRCSGVVASYPFHLIMVRQMAQFVGKETEYQNMFSSISEVYERDGILGFFAGLVPRLCGEVITIWFANILTHLVNTYLIPKSEGGRYMKSYTNAACALMISQVTYPFTLVSTIMTTNNCGLKAGQSPITPVYRSWMECWSHLAREKSLKRGSSVFMRYYKGPVTYRSDGTIIPMPMHY